MTDDEGLARRTLTQDVPTPSNNRVKDFIELIAALCVKRTADRNARAIPQPLKDEDTP